MPSHRALVAFLVVAIPMAACARVVVDPDPGFCLDWHEVADSPGAAAIPSDAACEIIAKSPHAGVVPPAGSEAVLTYVCVPAPPEGGCPAPALAKPAASTCLESESGDICNGGGHVGGYCASEKIWSMCGPDPAAEGGCCYWAYVVTSTILS